MSPKFVQMHRFTSGTPLMVNPRRLNGYWEERRTTQQPDLYCGTYLDFGRGESVLVRETMSDIKRLLK